MTPYPERMPVRLKDVAQHAGVSVKTVSNVVNDYGHVSPAMRTRVQAALDELGYRPNLAARQLKHGRGGFIALALPQLDTPYFAQLAARLQEEATRRSFLLLLDVTGADAEQERRALSGMPAHMVDGVIFSPLNVTQEEIEARTDHIPLVLLGERQRASLYDHVAVDSVAASRAVGQHLVSTGRRRLATIGHQVHEGTGQVRLAGFADAVRTAGLSLPPERTVELASYSREAGHAAMRSLLALPPEERPDAVFAFSDVLAIGALRACLEAGVRVPEDVAVVGFDDIAEAGFHTPTLTSVRPDLRFLASSVLDLLIRRIDGSTEAPQEVAVPWELVIRESSGG